MAEAAQHGRMVMGKTEQLDGDGLLELIVVTYRTVYRAHATLADAACQAVHPDSLPGEIGSSECGGDVLDSLDNSIQGATREGKQRFDFSP
jgi:hypothetical protein